MLCPNKNLPEWTELAGSLGVEYAMLAYIRNGNVIPTIAEADAILFNSELVNDASVAVSNEDDLYGRSEVDNTSLVAQTENSAKPMNVRELRSEGIYGTMNETAREVFDNFDTYFPEYRYLTSQQRYTFVHNMENGSLQIKCGI